MSAPSALDSKIQIARRRDSPDDQSLSDGDRCNSIDSGPEERENGQCADAPTPAEPSKPRRVQNRIIPVSGNLFFTSVVCKSQIRKPFQLVVPRSFCRFLPAINTPVVLTYQNKSWQMMYFGGRSFRRIGCGLKAFAVENHLRVGDGCVYELMNSEKLEFRVQILRGKVPSKFTSPEIDNGTDSKLKEPKLEPSTSASTPASKPRRERPTTGQRNDRHVPLTAGNPYFTSIVAKSQVSEPFSLVIPRRFHPFLPKSPVTVVFSYRNKSWKMKYSGQLALKRINSGWKKFALDNELKVGDACIYELIDHDSFEFRVQILRGEATKKMISS